MQSTRLNVQRDYDHASHSLELDPDKLFSQRLSYAVEKAIPQFKFGDFLPLRLLSINIKPKTQIFLARDDLNFLLLQVLQFQKEIQQPNHNLQKARAEPQPPKSGHPKRLVQTYKLVKVYTTNLRVDQSIFFSKINFVYQCFFRVEKSLVYLHQYRLVAGQQKGELQEIGKPLTCKIKISEQIKLHKFSQQKHIKHLSDNRCLVIRCGGWSEVFWEEQGRLLSLACKTNDLQTFVVEGVRKFIRFDQKVEEVGEDPKPCEEKKVQIRRTKMQGNGRALVAYKNGSIDIWAKQKSGKWVRENRVTDSKFQKKIYEVQSLPLHNLLVTVTELQIPFRYGPERKKVLSQKIERLENAQALQERQPRRFSITDDQLIRELFYMHRDLEAKKEKMRQRIFAVNIWDVGMQYCAFDIELIGYFRDIEVKDGIIYVLTDYCYYALDIARFGSPRTQHQHQKNKRIQVRDHILQRYSRQQYTYRIKQYSEAKVLFQKSQAIPQSRAASVQPYKWPDHKLILVNIEIESSELRNLEALLLKDLTRQQSKQPDLMADRPQQGDQSVSNLLPSQKIICIIVVDQKQKQVQSFKLTNKVSKQLCVYCRDQENKCLFVIEGENLLKINRGGQQSKKMLLVEEPLCLSISLDYSLLFFSSRQSASVYNIKHETYVTRHKLQPFSSIQHIDRQGHELLVLEESRASGFKRARIYDMSERAYIYQKTLHSYQKFKVDQQCNFAVVEGANKVQLLNVKPERKGTAVQTLKSYFSLQQLIRLKALVENRVDAKRLSQFIAEEPNMLHFYFNAAVLFGKQHLVAFMLEEHRIANFRADGIVLSDQSPLSYAFKYNLSKMYKQMLRQQSQRDVDGFEFSTDAQMPPEVMAEYLSSFVTEDEHPSDLPRHGIVRQGLAAVTSSDRNVYKLSLDELLEQNKLQASKKVRLLRLARPLDISLGSQQLIDVIHCFEKYSNQQVLCSQSRQLVAFLQGRYKWFQLVEGLVRMFILSLNIAAICTKLEWMYYASMVLMLLTLFYEIMTVVEFKGHFLNFANFLDLLCVVLTFANHVTHLASGNDQLVLQHLLLFCCILRLVFCLRFLRTVKSFLKGLVNVVTDTTPFGVVICVLMVLYTVIGYLVPTDQREASFGAEWIDTLKSILFGELDYAYLESLDVQAKIVKWVVIFTRQLFVTIFLLNGILVAIVENAYRRESKQLIEFKDTIELLIEHACFFKRLLWVLGLEYRFYLHALVTNHDPVQPEQQQLNEVKAEVIESLNRSQGQTVSSLRRSIRVFEQALRCCQIDNPLWSDKKRRSVMIRRKQTKK